MDELAPSFERIFNLNPDGNILVDDEGKIRIISKQAANIFGYDYSKKEQELLGKPIEILIPEEYRKAHPAQRSKFMENMGIRPMSDSLNLYGLKKDGTKISVEISLGGIYLNEKKYVLSTIRDVTKRKKLEHQLIEEREKVLESSKYTAIGELAGQIAHEINSPLGAISLITDFVLKNLEDSSKLDPDFLLKHIQQIKDIVEKISRITNAMRKLGGGTKQEAPVNVTLRSLIEDVSVLCAVKMKKIGAQFSIEYNGLDDQIIHCRLIEMSQVLVNLVSNAVDALQAFSHNHDSWIKVALNKNNDSIEISVINSGKTISSDQKEKIFEPYYTTKSLEHGTEIALAVSRNIVISHGGNLFLDAEQRDTTFVISLPVSQDVFQ